MSVDAGTDRHTQADVLSPVRRVKEGGKKPDEAAGVDKGARVSCVRHGVLIRFGDGCGGGGSLDVVVRVFFGVWWGWGPRQVDRWGLVEGGSWPLCLVSSSLYLAIVGSPSRPFPRSPPPNKTNLCVRL